VTLEEMIKVVLNRHKEAADAVPDDPPGILSGYLPFLDPDAPNFRIRALKRILRAITEYHTHRCHPNCFKKGKTVCRYRYPLKRFLYTFFCIRTGEIYPRRLSKWVNKFNMYLTLIAASNTDIQPLLKCKSAISIVFYITMYITKANQVDNWYAIAETAKKAIARTPAKPNDEYTEDQLQVRRFLLGIYRQAAKSCQISANIVATALLKLPLSYRSGEYCPLLLHTQVKEILNVSDEEIELAHQSNHIIDSMSVQ
jgi:hypothetical protein